MDAVYFLKHSRCQDVELRFSLRSVAKYFEDVDKVWIFGDCPDFISDDKSIIEHVPHQAIGDLIGLRSPITNGFQLFFASSLLPELSKEFLWFCDDFVLLKPITHADASTVRYLEDLDQVKVRGQGMWVESLWRTYDTLKRLQYPTFNFETHAPAYFRKKWIMDAYRDFRSWITDDRWLGMLGQTGILNHALKADAFEPVSILDPYVRAGFYGRSFQLADIQDECRQRMCMSYDERAFTPAMLTYLHECFPAPCRYEKADFGNWSLDAACFQMIATRQ